MVGLLHVSIVPLAPLADSTKHVLTQHYSVPRCRRALVYANIMILLGQLTGVNAIMYYMSVLMNQIGFSPENSNYMSLVGGGALLLGTIPAIFLMETCGRRFWANLMLPGFFVGLVLIGISYHIPLDTNLRGAEACYLLGLIIYMGFFGSYACLTWGMFCFWEEKGRCGAWSSLALTPLGSDSI